MGYTPGGRGQLGSGDPAPGGPAINSPTAMNATATVKRPRYTSDIAGTQSTTWVTVGTYSCSIDKVSGPAERIVGGGLRSISHWVATLPDGADVEPWDRLVVGTRTYEVVQTDAGITDAIELHAFLIYLE